MFGARFFVGLFVLLPAVAAGQLQTGQVEEETDQVLETPFAGTPLSITVRPAMLADHIDELAGHSVRVLRARVVGLFDARAFLIEPATRIQPARGFRDRILVLVRPGSLFVPADTLVGSSITVLGIARTLLGAQVNREVPFPRQLTRDAITRLDVRAAVLATSVQTPDGVELVQDGEPPASSPR